MGTAGGVLCAAAGRKCAAQRALHAVTGPAVSPPPHARAPYASTEGRYIVIKSRFCGPSGWMVSRTFVTLRGARSWAGRRRELRIARGRVPAGAGWSSGAAAVRHDSDVCACVRIGLCAPAEQCWGRLETELRDWHGAPCEAPDGAYTRAQCLRINRVKPALEHRSPFTPATAAPIAQLPVFRCAGPQGQSQGVAARRGDFPRRAAELDLQADRGGGR